jgi:hypothetical protein
MVDIVTVCDRENPGSWKERIFYKLGTPICSFVSKLNKNGYNIFKKKTNDSKAISIPCLFCVFS